MQHKKAVRFAEPLDTCGCQSSLPFRPQGTAFKTLARYIGVFGTAENTGAGKIAMTAPVVMGGVPTPIAMTAPVTMQVPPPCPPCSLCIPIGSAQGARLGPVLVAAWPSCKPPPPPPNKMTHASFYLWGLSKMTHTMFYPGGHILYKGCLQCCCKVCPYGGRFLGFMQSKPAALSSSSGATR